MAIAQTRNWLSCFLAPIADPLAYLETLPDWERMVGKGLGGDALGAALTDAVNADAILKQLEALLYHTPLISGHTGNKRAVFRGQGLDFTELRQYMPGDDLRKMDWQVFARTLVPHVREYHEERQMTVWVAVDLSPSLFCGSGLVNLKSGDHLATADVLPIRIRQAIAMMGLIGLLARQGQSLLGFYFFGGHPDTGQPIILKPKNGHARLHQGMETLLQQLTLATKAKAANLERPAKTSFSDNIGTSDIFADIFETGTRELLRLAGKQSAVFLLSDFMQHRPGWETALGELARKTILYSVLLADPTDTQLPQGLDVWPVVDPERLVMADIDTTSPEVRTAVYQALVAQQMQIESRLQALGRMVRVMPDEHPLSALMRLLQAGRQSMNQEGRSPAGGSGR